MLHAFSNLFRLYRNRFLIIQGRPKRIQTPTGKYIGQIDRLDYSATGIHLSGWSLASAVHLRCGNKKHLLSLVDRRDAQTVMATSRASGFEGSIPGYAPAKLCLDFDEHNIEIEIPPAGLLRSLWSEAILTGKFLRTCMSGVRLFVSWKIRRTPAHRADLKRHFGLSGPQSVRRICLDDLEQPPNEGVPQKFSVILPIHNGSEVLGETLRRLGQNTIGGWSAVLVDDCSTDPNVAWMIDDFLDRYPDKVSVLRNSENLGFLGSVNRAFRHLEGTSGPVVLLNSDAWVPPGWDIRLLAPLADRRVATVTPMSNNAEICSVPMICKASDIVGSDVDRIDLRARMLGSRVCASPTGVGFCMAMSHIWLQKVRAFDPAFGKGYGEEVDWCQRASALGGRNVIQPRLFVGHVGAVSFGNCERARRVSDASAMISSRYPNFDMEVQRFVAHDPLATGRFILAMEWAACQARELPVFVAHSMGGGAEISLAREIRQHSAAVVIRVGGPTRWQIEIHSTLGVTKMVTPDVTVLRRIFEGIENRRLIFSCCVGDPDPLELSTTVAGLVGSKGLGVRIHDYFLISPSVVLLDCKGRHLGVPEAGDENPAHRFQCPDGTEVSLRDWQLVWGRFLETSDEIRVFSDDSASKIKKAYPTAADKISVVPHNQFTTPSPVKAGLEATGIGVIGNLNLAKGAGILCDLGTHFRDQDPEILHLGTVAPEFSIPTRVRRLGPYDVADLSDLATKHQIGVWLIPSICPETFSFTTHEALATGLPVLGFDIGAQADALRAHSNGFVVPLGTTVQKLREELIRISSRNLAAQRAA